MVEADSLLKREVETLAEALETANNAVFLALSTISIMISVSSLSSMQSYPQILASFRQTTYHFLLPGDSSEVSEFTRWTDERTWTNGNRKSRISGDLSYLFIFMTFIP